MSGPRLLLLAHRPLASALRDLALHTFPECAADVQALDVDAGESLDGAAQRVRDWLLVGGGHPALVLVDVAGATPANALQRVMTEFPEVRAVAGLNLPMLWRTLCYRGEDATVLAERAASGAVRGIMPLINPASIS